MDKRERPHDIVASARDLSGREEKGGKGTNYWQKNQDTRTTSEKTGTARITLKEGPR